MAMLPLAVTVLADTSDTTQVSAQVGNRAVSVYDITAISAQDPTEGTTKAVTFYCAVNDPDGNSDIQVVNATMTKGAGLNSADCGSGSAINATANNYTCTVDMNFYDESGDDWDYTCYAYDLSTTDDMESTFTYNELTAWTMTPTSIGFGTIYLGQTNIGATDDPIELTNTGNVDLSGLIKVKALDLKGVTTPAEFIPAGNFSSNVADASGGDAMVNNSAITITGTSLDIGASSTEDLYFYIEEVPSSGLSYQTYNTAGLGQWAITTD